MSSPWLRGEEELKRCSAKQIEKIEAEREQERVFAAAAEAARK